MLSISIHAPSRERLSRCKSKLTSLNFNPRSLTGATCTESCAGSDAGDFNPRSLTGATQRQYAAVDDATAFQSTLPHGSDYAAMWTDEPLTGFQSTLPHGSDGAASCSPAGADISIHAPSRERREFLSILKSDVKRFQSTLPHGSDIDFYIFGCILGVFQSTLPHGSDSNMAVLADSRVISIHAPSRERP